MGRGSAIARALEVIAEFEVLVDGGPNGHTTPVGAALAMGFKYMARRSGLEVNTVRVRLPDVLVLPAVVDDPFIDPAMRLAWFEDLLAECLVVARGLVAEQKLLVSPSRSSPRRLWLRVRVRARPPTARSPSPPGL